MNRSKIYAMFAKRIPGLFSKESINQLVATNQISFEHARESLTAVDLGPEAHVEGNVDTNATVTKMQKLGFYANVKFSAMLEAASEDERMLYDEFRRVDNELDNIKSKIIAKKEGDINALLVASKTLPGVDPKEIDEVIRTCVRVEDVM